MDSNIDPVILTDEDREKDIKNKIRQMNID